MKSMKPNILLPAQIKVKVTREKSGSYFAELPEYDVFTEADNLSELVFNINDLVYTYFDIPRKDRGRVWYAPPLKQRKEEEFPLNPVHFKVLTEPDVQYSFA